MSKPVNDIAQHISERHFEDLPQDVVACAKRLILDTLAVAWAGAGAVGCKDVYTLTSQQGGTPESSVWVHGDKIPSVSAAFVNSLFASALDFDSFHEAGTLHSDIVVLPAALAMAERQGSSGKEFLTAFVLATDLTCRLGLSTVLRTGWFFTAIHGVIGAAAATARLLRLDTNGIKDAMGLAYLNAAGTQQAAIERSFAKRLESAFAARSGVHAGLLANQGCDGPHDFLLGQFGLYRMYEDGDASVVTHNLGRRYELSQITIKRYPSCACTHAAIDAIHHLIDEHQLSPDQVLSIEVSLSPYMNRLVGAPFSPKSNPQVSAQFSIQYALACGILFRRFGLDELDDAVIQDSRVLNMAKRVQVVVDKSNSGIMAPVTITVHTCSSKMLVETVTAVPGTPELPLSDCGILEKFRQCVQSGPRPLSEQTCQAVINKVLSLEQVDDMGGFLSMFGPAGPRV